MPDSSFRQWAGGQGRVVLEAFVASNGLIGELPPSVLAVLVVQRTSFLGAYHHARHVFLKRGTRGDEVDVVDAIIAQQLVDMLASVGPGSQISVEVPGHVELEACVAHTARPGLRNVTRARPSSRG